LEEDSEESFDQMAFRGIRQQVQKKDGMDVSFLGLYKVPDFELK
jgi:hypothetical protein